MESIYNIFKSELMGMHYQTALLEACDWDEALLEEFSSHLSMAFKFISEECSTYEEGLNMLKETLEINGWINGQYDIVVQLLEMHAQEIKEFMLLEEQ